MDEGFKLLSRTTYMSTKCLASYVWSIYMVLGLHDACPYSTGVSSGTYMQCCNALPCLGFATQPAELLYLPQPTPCNHVKSMCSSDWIALSQLVFVVIHVSPSSCTPSVAHFVRKGSSIPILLSTFNIYLFYH